MMCLASLRRKKDQKRWYVITNKVFEDDLTRDTLNRLIQRIDEKLSLTDETEHEVYYRPPLGMALTVKGLE